MEIYIKDLADKCAMVTKQNCTKQTDILKDEFLSGILITDPFTPDEEIQMMYSFLSELLKNLKKHIDPFGEIHDFERLLNEFKLFQSRNNFLNSYQVSHIITQWEKEFSSLKF